MSAFNLAKIDFNARLYISISIDIFKYVFVALDKSTLTLISPPKYFYGLGRY